MAIQYEEQFQEYTTLDLSQKAEKLLSVSLRILKYLCESKEVGGEEDEWKHVMRKLSKSAAVIRAFGRDSMHV